MERACASGPSGVIAVGLVASLLFSGCHHFDRRLVPLPPAGETAVLADIVGVALRPEAGGGMVEFREVFAVQWTPAALVIDGVIDQTGEVAPARRDTISFSYDDMSHLVMDAHPNPKEVRDQRFLAVLGGLAGTALLWILALATADFT